jgi:hypothetical protein
MPTGVEGWRLKLQGRGSLSLYSQARRRRCGREELGAACHVTPVAVIGFGPPPLPPSAPTSRQLTLSDYAGPPTKYHHPGHSFLSLSTDHLGWEQTPGK